MSMEENRAIVRRFFEALNQQNFAALKEHPGLYQTVERQPLIRAAFPDLPGLSLLKTRWASHILRVVRLSGLQRSRCWISRQPSEFVPGQSRGSNRAPQFRTSRTALATLIETIERWHCRSAPRLDCAHLERLVR
jgi:hypothetical protein